MNPRRRVCKRKVKGQRQGSPRENYPTRKSERMGNKKGRTQSSAVVVDEGVNGGMFNASSTDVPPEQLVFSNDLLMSMIVSCMEVTDLKKCRLVSKAFSYHATQELAKLKCFHLIGSYRQNGLGHGSTPSFYYKLGGTKQQTTVEKTLEDLTNLTKLSTVFPCRRYSFQGGSLNVPILQKFLNEQGSNIEEMVMTVHCSTVFPFIPIPTLDSLTTLLKIQVPQVKCLWLGSFPQEWSFNDGSSTNWLKGTRLPNLQMLQLPRSTSYDIFKGFVEAAINLRRVDLIMGDLNFFIKTNRVYLLKRIFVDPYDNNVHLYEKIANDPSLELFEIEFCINNNDFETPANIVLKTTQFLNKIFCKNSTTITKMRLNPIGFLPNLKIPTLPNVTSLTIGNDMIPLRFLPRTVLPVGLNLSNIFPALTTVMIDLDPQKAQQYRPDFLGAARDPIPTVKFLSINKAHKFSDFIMHFVFPRIFPNVTCGRFWGLADLPNATLGIWSFEKLEHLEVGFNVTAPIPYSIDPFFTGIQRLPFGQEFHEIDAISPQSSCPNMNPCLVSLTSLKRLEISFFDAVNYLRKDSTHYALHYSELTGRCGLQLCPALEVSVLVDAYKQENVKYLRDFVAPLRPFVSSGPW